MAQKKENHIDEHFCKAIYVAISGIPPQIYKRTNSTLSGDTTK